VAVLSSSGSDVSTSAEDRQRKIEELLREYE
jgi:hypothetical protein